MTKILMRSIVSELDALLNGYNELFKLLKSHMPKLQSDNHAIVINTDRTPAEEHLTHLLLTTLLESWLATVQLHYK